MNNIDNTKKHYWTSRTIRKTTLGRLKKFKLFQILFSVRAGDDAFLYSELPSQSTILDVACGAGKRSIVDLSTVCIGVDIKGFPKEALLSLGYTEALTWGENFSIPTEQKFDAVTFINMNAHIEFDLLDKMLEAVKKHLNTKAKIIFINEYNNDNAIYSLMKKNKKSFEAYVDKCEHYNFHYQIDFEGFISNKKWLKTNDTKVLSENPPSMHYFAYKNINMNKLYMRFLCLFLDIIISQINNFSRAETGFLVAHVYETIEL